MEVFLDPGCPRRAGAAFGSPKVIARSASHPHQRRHGVAQNCAHGETAVRLDTQPRIAGKRGTGGHTAPQDGPGAHACERAAAIKPRIIQPDT